jgi:hypothetical protein
MREPNKHRAVEQREQLAAASVYALLTRKPTADPARQAGRRNWQRV